MQVTVSTTSDGISATLRLVLSAAADKTPYLEVMGMAVVSVSKRSFTDSGLRAAVWRNKTDGSGSTLQKSTTLRRSVRISSIDGDGVTIGSDRKYAAIHQLGGTTRAHLIKVRKARALRFGGRFARSVKHPGSRMPARPFIPVIGGRLTATASAEAGEAITAKLRKVLGM
jgi:phage gpG-like protein